MLEKALLIVALKFSKVVCSNIFSFLACNNEIVKKFIEYSNRCLVTEENNLVLSLHA